MYEYFLLVEKLQNHWHDHQSQGYKIENYLSATLAYKPEGQILTKRCGWFQYHGTDKMENFPIFCKQTFWSRLLCINKYILYTIPQNSVNYCGRNCCCFEFRIARALGLLTRACFATPLPTYKSWLRKLLSSLCVRVSLWLAAYRYRWH